jgi:ubiquinone/menaquinone biosynthesis C-methylase UbiE
MLRAAAHPVLLNASITALPLRDGAVDIALAIHMLYHVPSRETAIAELRRVVAAGGTCGTAFESVSRVRPSSNPPVVIRDAAVAAGYVASLADLHQDETSRPWEEVTEDVRRQVQAVIAEDGAFITSGDLAAFLCR